MKYPPVNYIELNLSNYDAEDVAQLNEWAIWAAGYIEEVEEQNRVKNARVVELDEKLASCKRHRDFSHREACRLEERFTAWRAYALALQRLYDNGGPMMEPALAREVEELREKCE